MIDNETHIASSGLGGAGYGGYGFGGGIAPVGLFGVLGHGFGHDNHGHGHNDCDDLKDYMQNQKTHETVIDVAREVLTNRFETEKSIAKAVVDIKEQVGDMRVEFKDEICDVKGLIHKKAYQELERENERNREELNNLRYGNFPKVQSGAFVESNPCSQNSEIADLKNQIINIGGTVNQLLAAIGNTSK